MKRGEATMTFYIVSTLLIVIGFVIGVLLLSRLEFNEFSGDEACRVSVLTRATAPEAIARYAPLKCTTHKICFTKKLFGGKCEQFAGEEGVKTVRLWGMSSESAAEKIEEIAAKEMFTCWSMMGQGKLDLFAEPATADIFKEAGKALNIQQAKSSCVICGRLALDEELKKDVEILDKVNINEYMASTPVPGSSLTYLQALTDQGVRSFPQEFKIGLGADGKKKSTDQMGIVFMQIRTDESPEDAFQKGFIGGTGFVLGGGYALGGLGKLVSLPGILFTVGTGAIAGGVAAFGAQRDQTISAGYCGQFTSVEQSRLGCSITTVLDYNNIEEINNFCKRLEGMP